MLDTRLADGDTGVTSQNCSHRAAEVQTMGINWDDLRILAAVRECGTYAAASKALRLDETTVGRRLSRLETSLGLKLLDAVDGRRRPTQAAQGLLRHLEAMTRHVDDIMRVGQVTATQGLSGRVRIAATNALAEEVLAPHLAELLLSNPGLVIDLLTSTHTVNFSRWEADLAIRLRKPVRGDYAISRLASIPLFLFEPADSGELLICCYPDEQDDTPETRYLQRKGLQQKGRCVTASGRVIRNMIQSRQAIGILPEYLCWDMRSDPHFRVTELPQQREVWLLIQRHLKRDPSTRTVIGWLRSCFVRGRTTAAAQLRTNESG